MGATNNRASQRRFQRDYPDIATGDKWGWRCACGHVNPDGGFACANCGISWYAADRQIRDGKSLPADVRRAE